MRAIRIEAEARAERLVAIEAAAWVRAAADNALAAGRQAQELALRREQIARTRPIAVVGLAVACAAVAVAFALVAMQRGTALDAARVDARVERARAERGEYEVSDLRARLADVELDLTRARAAATKPIGAAPIGTAPTGHKPTRRPGVVPPMRPTRPPVVVTGDCVDHPLGCPDP